MKKQVIHHVRQSRIITPIIFSFIIEKMKFDQCYLEFNLVTNLLTKWLFRNKKGLAIID